MFANSNYDAGLIRVAAVGFILVRGAMRRNHLIKE